MNLLKTTPGSDCALKLARRLLSFICGKITAILLEERLLGVLGENICDQDPYDAEDQNFGKFLEKGICNQDFQGLKIQFISRKYPQV